MIFCDQLGGFAIHASKRNKAINDQPSNSDQHFSRHDNVRRTTIVRRDRHRRSFRLAAISRPALERHGRALYLPAKRASSCYKVGQSPTIRGLKATPKSAALVIGHIEMTASPIWGMLDQSEHVIFGVPFGRGPRH